MGTEKQTSVCIGEIGELLTLFGRDAQGRTTKEDWCSEIADVIICAWQLSRLAGIDIETQNNMICHKLNRVNHKLDTMESIKPGNRTLFDRAYEEANARIEKFHETVKKTMIKSESETQITRKQIHCAIKQIIYNELKFTKQDIVDIIEKTVENKTEELFNTYIRNNYSYHGALTNKLTKELARDFGPTIKKEVATKLGKYIIGHVEIKSNELSCDFNYDTD